MYVSGRKTHQAVFLRKTEDKVISTVCENQNTSLLIEEN